MALNPPRRQLAVNSPPPRSTSSLHHLAPPPSRTASLHRLAAAAF